MNQHEHPPPTPPSQAPGESGDPEAREEAEETVRPRTPDDEARKPSASGSTERRSSGQSTHATPPDQSNE
ncbi:hypothetical protein JHN63_16505 [Streptomyces sp. MBT65]|uniref:hypothetical protein n=1 Tax=Streptomyces sp. MBT65 TaxID=1488395 RepID=UPI00190DB01B|nr:hypothetical protein [Streptomyces sp. MBT65]MBK3575388.1 hypothetical protein [Streptomyces sp. MBT65]